jgi:hypothetical protein
MTFYFHIYYFFLTDQHTTAQVQVIYDIKETKYNSN